MLKNLENIQNELLKSSFFYSLNPQKLRPTSFVDIAKKHLQKFLSPTEQRSFLEDFEELILSQKTNFPENIFWDLDYLAHILSQQENAQKRKVLVNKITSLNEIYGQSGSLCFAYTHDFTYGFDWHRWVMRDPKTRSHVSPYDDVFLDYLLKRSGELKILIEKDDKKYPKLPPGRNRNPFSFTRMPREEIELHLKLVERSSCPLESWNEKAQEKFQFKENLHGFREELAHKLGLRSK